MFQEVEPKCRLVLEENTVSKIKALRPLVVVFALVMLLLTPAVIYAGTLATFDNPTLTECSLNGLRVTGRLTIRDAAFVEEYVDGELINTFTGPSGQYNGYVSFNPASAYPYTWKTVLTFKDSSGDIVEQYALSGDCTAENTGTVKWEEIELDPMVLDIS